MIDYAKPHSIGSIISNTYSLYLDNWPVLLLIGAWYVPFILMESAVRWAFYMDSDAINNAMTSISIFGTISSIIVWLPATIVQASLCVAILDICLDRKPTMARAYRVVFRRLRPILMVSLVVSILTTVGGLMFIVPGILLWLRYFLAMPVTLVEWRGWSDSMRRSAELARGEYLRNFVIFLIFGITMAMTIALFIVAFMLLGLFFGRLAGLGILGWVLSGILFVVAIVPLSTIPAILLYFDLRARKGEVGGGESAVT